MIKITEQLWIARVRQVPASLPLSIMTDSTGSGSTRAKVFIYFLFFSFFFLFFEIMFWWDFARFHYYLDTVNYLGLVFAKALAICLVQLEWVDMTQQNCTSTTREMMHGLQFMGRHVGLWCLLENYLYEIVFSRINFCFCFTCKLQIYNITNYLPYHPGSIEELMRGAGEDATCLFDEVHRWSIILCYVFVPAFSSFYTDSIVCYRVNLEFMLNKCMVGFLEQSSSEDSQNDNALHPDEWREFVIIERYCRMQIWIIAYGFCQEKEGRRK